MTGRDFTFSFQTVQGGSYVIQYTDSLDDPVWQILQTVAGDGSVKTFPIPLLEVRQSFYRLSAQ